MQLNMSNFQIKHTEYSMKIFIYPVILALIPINASSQIRSGWGDFIKDKIQESSRSFIERKIDDGVILADDKRSPCPSESNKQVIQQMNNVANTINQIMKINSSFYGMNSYPNAACQDWVKIPVWSNSETITQNNQGNNQINEAMQIILKSRGVTAEQMEIINKTNNSGNRNSVGSVNNLAASQQRFSSINASCLYKSKGNTNINCSSFIDLSSLRKGEGGIDYVFYTLWDYEKPVISMPNKLTANIIKYDRNNPLQVKSVRNIVGVSCSKKKYLFVGWMSNLDSMGFGLRASDGTYFGSGGLMNMSVNQDFDKSLDLKKLHDSEKVSEEFDKFSIDDKKSAKVIDLICSIEDKVELRSQLEKIE